jgi:hypothetical protein
MAYVLLLLSRGWRENGNVINTKKTALKALGPALR